MRQCVQEGMYNNIDAIKTHTSPLFRRRQLLARTVLLLIFIALLLALIIPWQRPMVRTLVFQNVAGLQVGDGVYLRGARIGEVRELELVGQHVRVGIEIGARYRDAVPESSHFLLWRDVLDPNRRSIRVQPVGH